MFMFNSVFFLNIFSILTKNMFSLYSLSSCCSPSKYLVNNFLLFHPSLCCTVGQSVINQVFQKRYNKYIPYSYNCLPGVVVMVDCGKTGKCTRCWMYLLVLILFEAWMKCISHDGGVSDDKYSSTKVFK